jgi:hypothetical protein
MIFVATSPEEWVAKSMDRLIDRSAWNRNSRKFAKNNALKGTKFIGHSSPVASVAVLDNDEGG